MQMIDQGIEDNKWLYWGICLKDQPAIIGTICLWNFVANENKAEIGYMMHPDQQGKGFMNEATRVVLSYGLQKLGLQCIEAFTHVENEASIKLLLKNNFLQCEHAGIPEHSTDLRFCIKP
jgi:ribosomal-protein-alanine N-acetyltransferase